jgi:riboflavin kinase/FMN adenylyltransferase
MYIVHDIENFEAYYDHSVLTLGVFDGMHRGHQQLISRLQKHSRRRSRPRVLVTYTPHPDLVLGKREQHRGCELFTYEEKLSLLQKFDLDIAVFLPFTLELARMTALRYLREIILGKLRADRIIIGYDQCFGRGRKGDYDFLKLMSRKYDYAVERIKAVKRKGDIISTSRIKYLLQKGAIEQANDLLGYEFFLTGMVVRGFQRGKTLGFPTANLEFPETKAIPAEGVYTAVAEWGGRKFRAMVNIGSNPTFQAENQTVEAHLLDFDTEIYGEQIRLFFYHRIRDVMPFDGPESLKAQLERDRKVAAKLKLD